MGSTVTAKEIISEVEHRISIGENLTEEQLTQTMGGLNGMDMKTYNRGYVDALRELKGYFETRV